LRDKVQGDDSFRNNLRLRFYGQTDPIVFQSLKDHGLLEHTEDFGQVDHWKSLDALRKSQVLLLPLNNALNVSGIIPGKLFEYLAANRPMIVIGPENGDTAKIVRETRAGQLAGFNDYNALKKIIDEYYEMYLDKKLAIEEVDIQKYSRRELTRALIRCAENSRS
jgi:hypothetical protein